VATLLVGLSAAGLLTGCAEEDQDQIARLAMPEPATESAVQISQLWNGAWIAAGIIGVFVWGLIIWAVVRYRRRDDDQVPVQNRYNLPIEVLYSVAPLIIVAVLFYYTVVVQREVLAGPCESPAYAGSSGTEAGQAEVGEGHRIEVVAAKWAWAFGYVDEPAVDGEDVFDIGTPEEFTDLYLPVGEPVTFELNSPDVIHSFWIPEFIFKLDVIPGKENCFTATPTREGRFVGRCAEFCGTYHPRMLFDVYIVSREEYDNHLRETMYTSNSIRGW
jgi:cytochrome c oxidase subunit 2